MDSLFQQSVFSSFGGSVDYRMPTPGRKCQSKFVPQKSPELIKKVQNVRSRMTEKGLKESYKDIYL